MAIRTLVIALAVAVAPAASAADLAARAAAALAHPGLRGAQVGALVVRVDDGAQLFARAAERPLVPASTLKILTAVAALETFGPAHRFTTRILADRAPDARGAVGTLYVQGGGDPALTSEQWWRLAADLRRSGLRRVEEGLVLDDSAFESRRWHEAWGEVTARAYHAPVGALSANYGAFEVEVRPGASPGAPALVALEPPVAYLRLSSQATTRPAGTPPKLVVDRNGAGGDTEVVRVSGGMPAGGEAWRHYASVGDPARYAGAVLRMQLAAVGIEAAAATRMGRVPDAAHELLAFEGESLARIVTLFVKYSNNPVAETLLKAMGRAATGEPGSWENGRAALRASLQRSGVDLRGLALVDGSGLSRGNRVAPRTLVDALRVARDSFRFGPELTAALPIAASDGTLRKRAEGAAGAVRAKTGLLDGVTGLAGIARAEEGELAFAVLANGYRAGDQAAMDALDAFAAALVASEATGRAPR